MSVELGFKVIAIGNMKDGKWSFIGKVKIASGKSVYTTSIDHRPLLF